MEDVIIITMGLIAGYMLFKRSSYKTPEIEAPRENKYKRGDKVQIIEEYDGMWGIYEKGLVYTIAYSPSWSVYCLEEMPMDKRGFTTWFAEDWLETPEFTEAPLWKKLEGIQND